MTNEYRRAPATHVSELMYGTNHLFAKSHGKILSLTARRNQMAETFRMKCRMIAASQSTVPLVSRQLRRPFVNSTPLSRNNTKVSASKGFGSPEKALKTKQEREFVMPPLPCNCGSGKAYKNCCELLHNGTKRASTPEAALRSRFSAFTLGLETFIADTTHPNCEHHNNIFNLHYIPRYIIVPV